MKNILTIVKKELLRVFKDKALIIALLMPGLLIYVMYSIMGGSMLDADKEAREATYKVVTVGMPNEVLAAFELAGVDNIDFYSFDMDDLDEKKVLLKNGDVDAVLVFSDSFIDDINALDVGEVTIYFNPSESKSNYAHQSVTLGLNAYRHIIMLARGDNNVVLEDIQAVYDEKAAAAGIFANMIPFLIITFLFSGCMSVAPDAIAGEKERGTIATILITPIKRSELALGKILALGTLATMSALSSFVGLMLALPKLLGDAADVVMYGFTEYVLILLVLITTVLLIIGVMSILSSLAKTVKEASMYIMPFMFVSMLIGLGSFISDGALSNPLIYLVPVLNSTQNLTAILNFSLSPLNLALCVASNVIYIGLSVFFLTKLFKNERVMFAK